MTHRLRPPKEARAPSGSAFDHALRLLARRPLTATETRDGLLAAGFPAAEVGDALARLARAGHLDDARLALHFILTRSERLGFSRERLLLELSNRGVAEAVAAEAWTRAVAEGHVDPDVLLRRQVERRTAAVGGRLDRRGYARVYNALLRAGFEPSAVVAALEPYRAGLDE